MDTNEMVKDAWSRYHALHEEAKRVLAKQNDYRQLYTWLETTFKLYPKSFEGLGQPEFPVQPPQLMPDIAQQRSGPSLPEMLGTLAGGLHTFQQEMSVSAKRKANEGALNRVAAILRESDQPMHLDDIVKKMKEDGWTGYPVDTPMSLYNALQAKARAKVEFVNTGENKWTTTDKWILT